MKHEAEYIEQAIEYIDMVSVDLDAIVQQRRSEYEEARKKYLDVLETCNKLDMARMMLMCTIPDKD